MTAILLISRGVKRKGPFCTDWKERKRMNRYGRIAKS